LGQHFHAKERNTRRVYMETHSAHLLPYSLNPTRKIFWLKKTGRRSECCRNTLCASLYLKPRSHREVVFVLNCFECGEENVSLHDLITHFWRETWLIMSHTWHDSSRWDKTHSYVAGNLCVTRLDNRYVVHSRNQFNRDMSKTPTHSRVPIRDSTDSSSWLRLRDSTDSSSWLDWLEFVTLFTWLDWLEYVTRLTRVRDSKYSRVPIIGVTNSSQSSHVLESVESCERGHELESVESRTRVSRVT